MQKHLADTRDREAEAKRKEAEAKRREAHMIEECQNMADREKDVRIQIEMLEHADTRERELEMQIELLKTAWKSNSPESFSRYFSSYGVNGCYGYDGVALSWRSNHPR